MSEQLCLDRCRECKHHRGDKRQAQAFDGCSCSTRLFERHYCSASVPHVEPEPGCALEELNAWLLEDAPGLDPMAQRDWLVAWSARRNRNVIDAWAKVLGEIAVVPSADDPASTLAAVRIGAAAALRALYSGERIA
jgi:hypothetical protein